MSVSIPFFDTAKGPLPSSPALTGWDRPRPADHDLPSDDDCDCDSQSSDDVDLFALDASPLLVDSLRPLALSAGLRGSAEPSGVDTLFSLGGPGALGPSRPPIVVQGLSEAAKSLLEPKPRALRNSVSVHAPHPQSLESLEGAHSHGLLPARSPSTSQRRASAHDALAHAAGFRAPSSSPSAAAGAGAMRVAISSHESRRLRALNQSAAPRPAHAPEASGLSSSSSSTTVDSSAGPTLPLPQHTPSQPSAPSAGAAAPAPAPSGEHIRRVSSDYRLYQHTHQPSKLLARRCSSTLPFAAGGSLSPPSSQSPSPIQRAGQLEQQVRALSRECSKLNLRLIEQSEPERRTWWLGLLHAALSNAQLACALLHFSAGFSRSLRSHRTGSDSGSWLTRWVFERARSWVSGDLTLVRRLYEGLLAGILGGAVNSVPMFTAHWALSHGPTRVRSAGCAIGMADAAYRLSRLLYRAADSKRIPRVVTLYAVHLVFAVVYCAAKLQVECGLEGLGAVRVL